MTYAIVCEADRAQSQYGDFASTHEALGVLQEEFDELRDAIRSNDLAAVAHEAMQVSAVAMRLYQLCQRALAGDAAAFKERSGATAPKTT